MAAVPSIPSAVPISSGPMSNPPANQAADATAHKVDALREQIEDREAQVTDGIEIAIGSGIFGPLCVLEAGATASNPVGWIVGAIAFLFIAIWGAYRAVKADMEAKVLYQEGMNLINQENQELVSRRQAQNSNMFKD